MVEAFIGVLLFLGVCGLVNIYKQKSHHSYSSHPWLFTTWYLTWLGIIVLILLPPIWLICALVIQVSLYLVFLSLWKRLSSGCLKHSYTVPSAFQEMTKPSVLSGIPKALEVSIQDLAAWLIVGSLLSYFTSVLVVALIFSTVVFLLHLPGVKMFGSVYGSYFLCMSTTFAFAVPLLYQFGYIGFCILFGLHLLCYVAMMLIFVRQR